MIDTQFKVKFEAKIPDSLKIVAFTRNRTDDEDNINDADNDRTINNLSFQSEGDTIRHIGILSKEQ